MRQSLTGEDQRSRAIDTLQGGFPSHRGFHGIRRAPGAHIGRGAQARQLLYWLVSRTIFTQANGVVGEHIDGALLHQRGHAHGVAAVLHEDQEGSAVRHEAAMQGDAVHDGSHTEFANTVINVVTAGVFFGQRLAAIPDGEVGARQVGRATQQFRQHRAIGVQGVLGRLAAGDRFAFVLALLNIRLGLLGEVRRQFSGHTTLELSGQLRFSLFVGGKRLLPLSLCGGAFFTGIPGTINFRRNLEGTVAPTQLLTGQCNFVLSQRCAVTGFGALLVGGTKTNNGLAADQRGLGCIRPASLNGSANGLRVMSVNSRDYLPAVGFKTLGRVVGKPAVHFTVDGDAVVVIEHDQLAKAQCTSQGRHLVGNTFHQAAIAQEGVGVVINNIMARAIELLRQGFLCQRKADRIGNTLPERPRSGFNTRRVAVFRMARGFGVQLAEVLDVFDGDVIAAQVQQGILQHGAMAVGQHKPVTVSPLGVGRVVAKEIIPEDLGDVRHTHGRARVAGFGFLNRIHAQRANGVGEICARRH